MHDSPCSKYQLNVCFREQLTIQVQHPLMNCSCMQCICEDSSDASGWQHMAWFAFLAVCYRTQLASQVQHPFLSCSCMLYPYEDLFDAGAREAGKLVQVQAQGLQS